MNTSPDDAWLYPLDSKPNPYRKLKCWWNGFVGLAGFAALLLGMIVMLCEDWKKYPPWIKQFVGFTLLIEVCVGLCALTSVCCIFMTLGKDAMTHSLTVVGLASDGLLSLAYAVNSVWGAFVLHYLLWTSTVKIDEIKLGLCLYVTSIWLTATVYVFKRFPVLLGVIRFGLAHIKQKFQGTPIVRFYTEYNNGDEHYVRVMSLEECSEMVENMKNPIAVRG